MAVNTNLKKRNVTAIEWLGIVLIFIISVVTSYVYVTQRLARSDTDPAVRQTISHPSESGNME